MFTPSFSVSLGDMLYLFFQSVYFFNSLDFGGYSWFIFSLIVLVSLALIIGFVYIILHTVFMKKKMAMMTTVLGQEGEVVELLDDFGKKGWILIYGENWKFKSQQILKVGDTVKVIRHKKMNLIVEKVEES